MTTQAEAYAALRNAGLKHADPDLVRLFDLNAPDYVSAAKAAKPDLFKFDARNASAAEVDEKLREMAQAANQSRGERATAAVIAGFGAEYAVEDARRAERAASLRRSGMR